MRIGPQEQYVPYTKRNSEENSPNLLSEAQCVPCTNRYLEQNSPKSLIQEECVPLAVGNSEQLKRNVIVLPYRERYVPTV